MTVPFCWQDKRILRRIREECDEYRTAVAVYYALTNVASDKATEEFTTTHKWLAHLSGFSDRTVRSRLVDLQRIGIIEVTTPKLKAPCTYRLLPFGNGCPTSGNGCRAFGNCNGTSVSAIRRKEERNRKTTAPSELGTAERIKLERQLKVLTAKRDALSGDLSDQVARETHPDKVQELEEIRTRIGEVEGRLGYG